MRPSFIAAIAAVVLCSSIIAQVPALTTQVAGNGPTNGLSQPLYVCAPPGDLNRLFVVQKNGQIKVRTPANAAGVWGTFLNIGAGGLALISTGSEQGLLGMAFHPNYATNGHFFVMYTSTPSPGNNVVARYTVSAGNPDVANPASGVIFLSIADFASNHNAGCLQFGPDGYLYVGTGDGGLANDPNQNGQNINAMLGKMHRIDVDTPNPPLTNYSSPPTNPFVGIAGLDEIWAIGLRNPFRYSFDRLTGDLWIGDVGQDTLEEIDFQPATNSTGQFGGRNYGWRCREGTFCTGLMGCGTCPTATFTEPVTTLSTAPPTSVAIIGGYVYRGCAIPGLRGHYIYGEYGSGQLWRLTYNGTAITSGPTLLPFTVTQLAGFGEDGHGELYACSLSGNAVYKIVPTVTQLTGITSYGTGTPGCSGASLLSLACPATIGNPGEAIKGTNGAPGTTAIGLLGGVSLPPGSDPLGIAVEVLVDLSPATLLYEIPVGPNGTTVVPLAIPYIPSIVGLTFYTQQFYVWSGPCTPSPLSVSSTHGLSFTILP